MKKIAFFSVLSFFSHHLIITILYLLPVNPMTNLYGSYVSQYMHPFFIQKWELFAPEPAIYSMRMYYRCQMEDTKWNDWKDSISGLIQAHQKNRFTYRGKLIYVYQGFFRSLANAKAEIIQRECPSPSENCIGVEKPIRSLPEYEKVDRLVFKLCQQEKDIINHEFSLARVYSKDFSKRHDSNISRKMDVDIYKNREELNL